MRVLIVGAGGHGQVVADILLRMGESRGDVEPVGFLDDDPKLAGRSILGLPVLGTTYDIGEVEHEAVIIAIGDNETRRCLFDILRSGGERLFTARHPNTVIAPDVKLGPGSVVCAGAVVSTGSVIGANVILNTSCSVSHHSHVGDHVHVAPGARLGGEVTLGEGVLVGISATVLPRKHVGNWNTVGAGAVVCDDVPGGVTVAGVPARPLERRWPLVLSEVQSTQRPQPVKASGKRRVQLDPRAVDWPVSTNAR